MRRRSSHAPVRSGRRSKRSVRRRHVHRTTVSNSNVGKWSFRAVLFSCIAAAAVYGSIRGYIAARDLVQNSEYLRIRSISITGGKNVLRSEILPLLPFDVGDHLLFQDLGNVRKKIMELKPELKNVHIYRGWKSINIKISERVPMGWISVKGSRQGIDSDNVPFSLRGSYAQASLPEIVAQTPDVRAELLKFLEQYSSQASDLYAGTKRIYIKPVDSIACDCDAYTIIWGQYERSAFSNKLKRLRQVRADASTRFSGIDYINLNYLDSGRVLVRPRSAVGIQEKPGTR
jgi:cell division septal protein FtsQ